MSEMEDKIVYIAQFLTLIVIELILTIRFWIFSGEGEASRDGTSCWASDYSGSIATYT